MPIRLHLIAESELSPQGFLAVAAANQREEQRRQDIKCYLRESKRLGERARSGIEALQRRSD